MLEKSCPGISFLRDGVHAIKTAGSGQLSGIASIAEPAPVRSAPPTVGSAPGRDAVHGLVNPALSHDLALFLASGDCLGGGTSGVLSSLMGRLPPLQGLSFDALARTLRDVAAMLAPVEVFHVKRLHLYFEARPGRSPGLAADASFQLLPSLTATLASLDQPRLAHALNDRQLTRIRHLQGALIFNANVNKSSSEPRFYSSPANRSVRGSDAALALRYTSRKAELADSVRGSIFQQLHRNRDTLRTVMTHGERRALIRLLDLLPDELGWSSPMLECELNRALQSDTLKAADPKLLCNLIAACRSNPNFIGNSPDARALGRLIARLINM